jgi:hypothetical protein
MTLLNYEEQGLIHPGRTGGGHRRYNVEELDRIFRNSGLSFDVSMHHYRFLEWYGQQLQTSPRNALSFIIEEAMLDRIAAYQEIPMANNVEVEIWTEGDDNKLHPSRIYDHNETLYTEGVKGKRYAIKVRNRSPGRILAVVSVDGLDIHDGQDAAHDKDGFVIPAFDEYVFEGFRTSNEEVAAFRFGAQEKGYASKKGKARNIGVIGVAIYQEHVVRQPYPIFQHHHHWHHHHQPQGIPWFTITTNNDAGPRVLTQTDQDPPHIPSMGRKGSGVRKRSVKSKRYGASLSLSSLGQEIEDSGYTVKACSMPVAHSADMETYSCNVSNTYTDSAEVEEKTSGNIATVFGEARESRVAETTFERKTETPWQILTIRYDSKANLKKLGVPLVEKDLEQRETADPFPASSNFCKPPEDWTG